MVRPILCKGKSRLDMVWRAVLTEQRRIFATSLLFSMMMSLFIKHLLIWVDGKSSDLLKWFLIKKSNARKHIFRLCISLCRFTAVRLFAASFFLQLSSPLERLHPFRLSPEDFLRNVRSCGLCGSRVTHTAEKVEDMLIFSYRGSLSFRDYHRQFS